MPNKKLDCSSLLKPKLPQKIFYIFRNINTYQQSAIKDEDCK